MQALALPGFSSNLAGGGVIAGETRRATSMTHFHLGLLAPSGGGVVTNCPESSVRNQPPLPAAKWQVHICRCIGLRSKQKNVA